MTRPRPTPQVGGKEGELPFIGILDIFGFEAFETNSFEQLCINFANEMLQAQFNADTFRFQQVEPPGGGRLEDTSMTRPRRAPQAEYEAEGVPWQHIEYEDNTAIIELLAARRVGAFALLDEECRLQTGTAGQGGGSLCGAPLHAPRCGQGRPTPSSRSSRGRGPPATSSSLSQS